MFRAVVFAIALAGCRDQTVERVKDVRDEVCACKTVACGEAAMKTLPENTPKPNHRAQQFATEMLNCMSKLYLRERPATDPDEPATSAEAPGSGSGSALAPAPSR
ncbi:MAG: hypothetical protein ABI867_20070 [Kofleriaceae bacterium]